MTAPTTTTTDGCDSSPGTKIALGIVTILLSLSEVLALSRTTSVNGILDAILAWGKRRFSTTSGNSAADGSQQQPAPLENTNVTAALERAETALKEITQAKAFSKAV